MSRKVFISNGHGLNTPGKRTPPFPKTGKVIKEWEFNYPTAKALEGKTKNQGYETIMVSDTSNDTPLSTRTGIANRNCHDVNKCVYASIHFNAYRSKWGNHGGIETLYNPISKNGKKLAQEVQSKMVKATGLRDRGIKPRKNLAELNRTKMPAIIVECGFMDNLEEANLMLNEAYHETCAQAILEGINSYFGVETKHDKNRVKIKYQDKVFSVNGMLKDGRNYIPIRVLEEFGHTVHWNNDLKQVEVD